MESEGREGGNASRLPNLRDPGNATGAQQAPHPRKWRLHLNPSWRSVGEHARCPEHRSCAPHVELHLFNHRAGAGLDVVSPRVKGETLADEAHALAHLLRGGSAVASAGHLS